jgi:TolB-like protein
MLRLRTLGDLSLTCDGRPLPLGRSKRALLLAYLAVDRPLRSHTRAELQELFWPGRPNAGRQALRQSLHVLRALLGEALVLEGRERVRIDPLQLTTDAGTLLERPGATSVESAAGRFLETVQPAGSRRLRAWIAHVRSELSLHTGATAEARVTLGSSTQDAQISPVFSVAVLPLSHPSDAPELGWICDAITGEMIADLSRVPGLRVPARTSSFQFRGPGHPGQDVARRLRVRFLLEGALQPQGDGGSIALRLSEPFLGREVWRGTVPLPGRDLLNVPEQVSRQVLPALSARLKGPRVCPSGRATSDPEAFLAYLRGMHHYGQKTPADFDAALEHFRHAAERDPAYAAPWGGMAMVWESIPVYSGRSPDSCYPQAIELARRGLALNDQDTLVQHALGMAHIMYRWDWDSAAPFLERAMRLDPWDVHHLLAAAVYLHMPRGEFQRAIPAAEQALELDPLSIQVHAYLADTLYFAREHRRSIQLSRAALELDEHFVLARWMLLWALNETGEHEEALQHARVLEQRTGGSPIFRAEVARALAVAGQHDAARTLLAELRALPGGPATYPLATGYAALGERGSAVELLEQAVQQRSNYLVFAAVDPKLETLRPDPGFKRVLRTLGLDGVRM